jgi:hypothetical protein
MAGLSTGNIVSHQKNSPRTFDNDSIPSNRMSRRSSADTSDVGFYPIAMDEYEAKKAVHKDDDKAPIEGMHLSPRKPKPKPAHHSHGAAFAKPRSGSITRHPSLAPVKKSREPLNFGMVIPGVFRCSQPNINDLGFVRQLGLKSVLYVDGLDPTTTGWTVMGMR